MLIINGIEYEISVGKYRAYLDCDKDYPYHLLSMDLISGKINVNYASERVRQTGISHAIIVAFEKCYRMRAFA
jgi:hypothetical protein